MKTKNFYRMSFILMVLFLGWSLLAKDVVRLLERTQSGRLLRLNLGQNGLSAGEIGLMVALLKQPKGISPQQYRHLPLGRAQLVQAGKENSLWFLQSLGAREQFLKVGARYLLLRKNNLLRGKIREQVHKRTVILHDQRNLDDDEIVFRKNDGSYQQIHDFPWLSQDKFELVDIAKWKKYREEQLWMNPEWQNLTRSAIIRHSSDVDLASVKELEAYEKMLVSYLSKLNHPELSWQSRLKLEQAAIEKRSKSELSLKRDKLSKSKIINNNNRERSGQALNGNFTFSLGLNLADNQLVSDAGSRRGAKIHFEASYEWFALQNFQNYFQNFSFELSLRYALDGLASGQVNALTRQVSGALGLNWYPFGGAYQLDKSLYFFGGRLRLGSASVMVGKNSEQGIYSLAGLGLLAGYRYNFNKGWGVKALASVEPLSLKKSSQNSQVVHLRDSLEMSDFRLQIGLNYVF